MASPTLPSAPESSSSTPRPAPPTLKIYIAVTVVWPLPPGHDLEQTRGTRLAGAYLTRTEAMHRAHEFLHERSLRAIDPFFTDYGQTGYRVRSPVLLTRAWVEEVELEMTVPERRDVPEVIAELGGGVAEPDRCNFC